MSKIVLIVALFMLPVSCAPVLKKEIMETASPHVPFSELKKSPLLNRGKRFLLGGIIVNTKLTKEGSLVEAVYVPVDSRGYLRGTEYSGGRYLALQRKEQGHLDPLIYSSGREITIAGSFLEIQSGKLDEMDYAYPLFAIEDIYLWDKRDRYVYPSYHPWYYPYPYWWDYPYWRYRYYPPYPFFW